MTAPTPLDGRADAPAQRVDSAHGTRRIVTGTRTLRQHAARGTLINGAFQVGLASLTFLRGFIVAAFLTRRDFGLWGILVVGLGTISWLKGGAISEKYVQQSDDDQESAFQTAFSIELMMTAALAVLMALALPVIALIYGQWRIVAPGLVMALLVIPASSMQTPQWVFYRSMDFGRQRVLQAADPVVAFAATVGLAVAGAGYWSLVLGQLVGSLAGGIITLHAAPFRFRWSTDRGSLRSYLAFSWPVVIAGGAAIVMAQSSLLIANTVLGLAAVGAVTLASQISGYADGIDGIVTGTLYPAICAVQDRAELLFESFVKSNRLAVMWGMPFGIGMAVFAPQLVHFVIGERWHPAIGLIQIFGLTAASHQVGFNWTAFYSARGNTRPLAVVNAILLVVFLIAAIPLTIGDGLTGMGIALLAMVVVGLAARTFYLRRLFAGFRMWRHLLRAIAPTIPAVGCTLFLRLLSGTPTTLGAALVELAVYALATLAGTWYFERELLREVMGYLTRGSRDPTVPVAPEVA